MAHRIRDSLGCKKTLAHALLVKLGPGISVRHGNLNGLAVDFLGVLDSLLYGVSRLAGQADDEIAMNPDTHFFAVLDKRPSHLDRRALLDIFENLRVA